MASKGMKVEGAAEASRAFNRVDDKLQDLSKAHKAEAEMLLPDVLSATRFDSGTLRAGWRTDGEAEQAHFLNDVEYAGIQEFGWAEHNIDPTNAIANAFAGNTERTEAVYAEAIRDIAEQTGFDTN
jgi:hypothetical protein